MHARLPRAVADLIGWWLLLALLTSVSVGFTAAPFGRAWLGAHVGEEAWLPQLKGATDLARQWFRPRLRTADDLIPQRTTQGFAGVNAFLHHEVGEARRRAAVGLAAQAGFGYLRQPMPWQDVEIHAAGDFEDRRNDPPRSAWYKYDTIVRQARAQGLEVIFRLDDPPAWAIGNEDVMGSQAPPRNLGSYADFVTAVARRYKGQVRHLQLWNEPNIHPEWGNQPVSPEKYAELLKAASTAARTANPEAVIVLAAMAATTTYDGVSRAGGGLNDLVYLDRLYRAGAAPYFDVLAVQGYGLWSGPWDRRMHPLVINFSRARFVRDLMVRHGDAHKPIWIAEMNWNTVPPGRDAPFGRVSEDTQARFLVQAFERIEEWPWMELANVWYLKRARPDWENAGDPQAHFRLLTYDGRPSPAFYALADYLRKE